MKSPTLLGIRLRHNAVLGLLAFAAVMACATQQGPALFIRWRTTISKMARRLAARSRPTARLALSRRVELYEFRYLPQPAFRGPPSELSPNRLQLRQAITLFPTSQQRFRQCHKSISDIVPLFTYFTVVDPYAILDYENYYPAPPNPSQDDTYTANNPSGANLFSTYANSGRAQSIPTRWSLPRSSRNHPRLFSSR